MRAGVPDAPARPEREHGGQETGAAPPPRVPWLHTFKARVVYWLTVILAVYALSRCFDYGRMLAGSAETAGGSAAEGAVLGAVWLLVLLGAMFVLALYMYEGLRWKGELARTSPLFEKILSRGEGAEE